MNCLLCDLKIENDKVLKDHYKNIHLIEQDNYYFKELLTPDFNNKYSKSCVECEGLLFETCRKKEPLFLLHYKQLGRSLALPLNISRRGNQITIHSINSSIHKKSHDFFNAERTIKSFISVVKNRFVPKGKVSSRKH